MKQIIKDIAVQTKKWPNIKIISDSYERITVDNT